MCTTSPPTFETSRSRNDKRSNLLVDEIVVRRFEDKDQQQVQALFRSGMESLVPTLTRMLITDPVFFLPVGGMAWLVKLGVAKVISMSSSSVKRQNRALIALSNAIWSSIPLITSAGLVAASVLVTYGVCSRMLGGYIQNSIATDLSDIPKFYFTKGGTFLVAENKSTGRIVGCVGGENKVDKPEKRMFELRRMSVDPKVQRCGLGRRLVESLEQHLSKVDCRHISLGTSSIQKAACHLYSKSGFTLTETIRLQSKSDPLLVRRAVQFYRFDKYYGDAHSHDHKNNH